MTSLARDPWTMEAVGSDKPSFDAVEARRALLALLDPDGAHELRGLPSGRSRLVAVGEIEAAMDAARSLADDRGLYYTLNPVDPERGDRAARNRDILRRRWFLVDVDPIKAPDAADLSASDAERETAMEAGRDLVEHLSALGWPNPLAIDSGNGCHLLWRIDLPNDETARNLIRAALKALKARWPGVDASVHNASRIAKLPGTWARKGPDTPERPHRRCRLLAVPAEPEVVPAELLAALATEAGGTLFDPSATNGHETNGPDWSMGAPVAGDSTRRSAYLARALEGELLKVAMAPVGERNVRLNTSAFKVGQLVGEGLDVGEATARLLAAATRAGLSESEAAGVIGRAIEDGRQAPRSIPDPPPDGHSGNSVNFAATHAGARAHARPRNCHNCQNSGPEWGEPLVGEEGEIPPFPLDTLPPPISHFIFEGAGSLCCPIDFLAAGVLGVASGAIGRSLAIALKDGWTENVSLYLALVGDPGMTKSPALALAARPLWAIARGLLEEHRLDAAARKALGDKSAGPPPRRVVVEDSTVEALATLLRDNPRGLVMVRDELSALFAGHNQYKGGKGADRQFYLSAWSGSPATVDRKGNADSVPIHIPHPFLSVVGGMTPGMLSELAEAKGRDDGFLDRMLFVRPAPVKVRWRDEGVRPAAFEAWAAAVRALWARPMVPDPDGPRPYLVRLSADARDAFGAWFDAHCAEAEAEDFPAYLRGPWAKLRAYCARLALVLDRLDLACRGDDDPDDGRELPASAVERAARLVGYFKAHGRLVRGLMRGESADDPDARAVLGWVRRVGKPSFTVRDLRRNFPTRFPKDGRELGRALHWLEARRCVRPAATPERSGPGRPPSPTFEVNPMLLAQEDDDES